MNRTLATYALGLAIASGVHPQPFCVATDTLAECESRVEAALVSPETGAAEILAEAPETPVPATGDGSASRLALDILSRRLGNKLPPEIAELPGASTALEDFLSRLRISLATTQLEGSGKTALAVELADFLGLPTKQGYKLQALLRPAELASGLASQLSGEEVAAATKELGDFDDILMTFGYSPTTERLGRRLAYTEPLARELLLEGVTSLQAVRRQDRARLLDRQLRLLAEVERLDASLVDDDGNLVGPFESIPDAALRARLLDVTEARERVRWASQAELRGALDAHGYFRLADLVANQPQLVVSLARTIRDPAVGAEETTGKISYEVGFTNVNGLRRFAADHCDDEVSLGCLDRFLDEKGRGRAHAGNAGYRLKFTAEYASVERERLTLGSASLDVAGYERWNGSVAYGRNLRVDGEGTVLLRTDLTGTYEDWSDDPEKQDRTLVKLTFTQRLSDDLAVVAGAVWASKPELRGEVDEELSARAGITWSLDRKAD